MIPARKYIRNFVAHSLILLFLTACSSKMVAIQSANDPLLSYTSVYAQLEKGDDGIYRFADFTLMPVDNHVRLNDLKHYFPKENAECAAGLASNDNPLCKTNEDIFRAKTVDSGDVLKNTLGNAVVGVMTYGVGISAHYTTEFDVEAYNAAITQALDGFDREGLIKSVHEIVVSGRERIATLNAQIEDQRTAIEKNVIGKSKVVDQSGLYSGGVPAVSITGNRIEVSIMENCSECWSSPSDLEKIFDARIENSLHGIMMDVSAGGIDGFNYDVIGNDQRFAYGDRDGEGIVFTISSKKRMSFRVMPKVEDAMVAVETDARGNLIFRNKSTKYVKFQSVSLYLGSDISTKTDIAVELPPKGMKEIYRLSSFENSARHLELKNVTASSLNKTLSYGLAAKYLLMDTDREMTLFAEFSKRYKELKNI